MAAWIAPFASVAALVIATSSACFSPAIDRVRCDESGLCPSGMVCLTNDGGDEALVAVFDNLSIGSAQRLTASGSRPLVLAGGGAVWLSAAMAIDVSGNVNASGGGGFGGNGGGGGGGGGASGGMVALEAPSVSVAGAVVANGGSGGGGGSQVGSGNDGAAGLLLPSQVEGGEGRGVGGDGGSGGAYAGPSTEGDSGNGPVAGGGGGGGAVGAVKIFGLFDGDGVVSPQPTP